MHARTCAAGIPIYGCGYQAHVLHGTNTAVLSVPQKCSNSCSTPATRPAPPHVHENVHAHSTQPCVRTRRQAPECSHPHLSDACNPPGTCPSWSVPSSLTVVMSWSGQDGATFRCSARIRMSLFAGARLVMFICLRIRIILACRPSCTESPAMPVLCSHDRPGCYAAGGPSVPLTSTVTPHKRCSTRYPFTLSAATICPRSKNRASSTFRAFLHTV